MIRVEDLVSRVKAEGSRTWQTDRTSWCAASAFETSLTWGFEVVCGFEALLIRRIYGRSCRSFDLGCGFGVQNSGF